MGEHDRTLTVTEAIGLYKFRWASGNGHLPLDITVSRVKEHSDAIKAKISFSTESNGEFQHLHTVVGSLTTTRFRQDEARFMSARHGGIFPGLDWITALEDMCRETLDRHHRGEPMVWIEAYEGQVIPPKEYLIKPMVPKGDIMLLYGKGGKGKGWLALVLAGIMTKNWTDNPLGLEPWDGPTNVLYLDWEAKSEDISTRIAKLCQGSGFPYFGCWHRRCSAPIPHEAERIQEMILEKDIGCIIVDSLGMACGGDLNSNQDAIATMSAIRAMNVSAILISHPNKNPEGQALPFGSIYFWNESRSIWHVESEQEADSDFLELSVSHVKANESRISAPLFFRLDFDQVKDTVCVKAIGATQVTTTTVKSTMSGPQRLLVALREIKRAASPTEIAAIMNEKVASVNVWLLRLKERQSVVPRGDGTWGLST